MAPYDGLEEPRIERAIGRDGEALEKFVRLLGPEVEWARSMDPL